MRSVIETLDRSLKGWEDFWFLVAAMNRALGQTGQAQLCENAGAVRNYLNLRAALLRSRPEDDVDERLRDFLGPTLDPDFEGSGQWHDGIVTSLMYWTCHSRRVYSLSRDLATLLQLTGLGGVAISSVRFPFPCFAMCLEHPVPYRNKDVRFIVVHVVRQGDEETMDVRLFFSDDSSVTLSAYQRQRILDAARARKWDRSYMLAAQALGTMKAASTYSFSFTFDRSRDATALDAFDQARASAEVTYEEEQLAHFGEDEKFARLVLGFCLYRLSLGGAQKAFSEWREPLRSGRPDSKAISSGAQVCTVASVYELRDDERALLGPSKCAFEMCCHFRQGHWRRPPGEGHNPDAPRTVWVRPTLVRRDRLGDEQLPGGTQQILQ